MQSDINNAAGEVHIAEEVIATIASISATSVKGVAGMSSGLTGGFAEALGKKNLSKGVKVEVKDKMITLHLNLIVDYGCKIPDISWKIQDRVKAMVENMTAMKVRQVNVHVQAVKFPEETDESPKEE
ncbi:MAG: Asp23/Gls24 family envelope stress response protein [Tindallia sp. MSAO_Bac2]|nr:MAG: Asp23/Gls24 family envelope stress response protein [Tindallia sp. MSAO_Bac2]